ncbi:MAG: hypothetical protein BWY85_01920 [Firmicutes bacterium ADurb.Bin506]|nr:MAG: hypothetical protein BWY85_01920 [Firmicutes bacterium ADurb.Bin506]
MPRTVLVPPGVDVIEHYGGRPAPRAGCARFVGPAVIALLSLAVIAGVTQSRGAEETPMPTVASLPTVTLTLTSTVTPTATETPTMTVTSTATTTATATATVTITPTASWTPTVTPLPWIMGRVVGATYINVRYGPGVTYPTLGNGARLRAETAVRLVGRDEGARWAMMSEPTQGGWISMAYVHADESIARLPIVQAPPPVED